MSSSSTKSAMNILPSPHASKYKTALCRHWLNGYCERGSTCLFAHGKRDLIVRKKIDPQVCVKIEKGVDDHPQMIEDDFILL